MTIAAHTIDKLGKLFPRLASDHDGEVVATARAIIRTLESAGSSLHELAGEMHPKVRVVDRVVYREKPEPKKRKPRKAKDPDPAPPPPPPDRVKVLWTDVIRWAPYLIADCDLNEREVAFLTSIHKWAKAYKNKLTLTTKQADWWARILIENDIQQGTAA